jgi:hypothetical protein
MNSIKYHSAMKKNLIYMLLMSAFAFVACDKAESPKDIIVQNGGQPQTLFADDAKGSSGVSFTTTGPWSSSIVEATSTRAAAPDWIVISPDGGKEAGEYTISITLDVNTTGKDRTAVITISSGGTEITITITQKGTKEDGTVPDDPDDHDKAGWVKRINGEEVVYGTTDNRGITYVNKVGNKSYTTKIISMTLWSYVYDGTMQNVYEYNPGGIITGVTTHVDDSAYGYTTECQWDGDKLSHIRGDQYGVTRDGILNTEFIYGTTEYRLGNIDINWLLGASQYYTGLPVAAIGVRTSGDNYKLLAGKTQTDPSTGGKYDDTYTYRYEFNDDGYIAKIYETSSWYSEEQLIYTFEY